MIELITRYQAVVARIRALEQQYQRPPNSVRLLAASKTHPASAIHALIQSGQYAFGENYVQEALAKMDACQALPIEWHFIGPLQRNKTRHVAERFHWLQSLDSLLIAERLNRQRPAHLPPLNVCIEVNIDHDPQKSGVRADQVHALAQQILQLPRLCLRGLMTIPQQRASFADQCASFQEMYKLYSELQGSGFTLDTLSMGMSHDLEAAVASGSTMVRVGTSIFGQRQE